jgi:hypothetical protein
MSGSRHMLYPMRRSQSLLRHNSLHHPPELVTLRTGNDYPHTALLAEERLLR